LKLPHVFYLVIMNYFGWFLYSIFAIYWIIVKALGLINDVVNTLVCYNWNFSNHGKFAWHLQVISLFCLHYYIIWHGLWLWLWRSPICCRLITLWLMSKVIFLLMVAFSLSCFEDLAIHMTQRISPCQGCKWIKWDDPLIETG
jgi:hypothetical protein